MRKSGISIMARLIVLVKSLSHIMFITIVMGILGYLTSIFITIFGIYGIISVFGLDEAIFTTKTIFISVIIFAILRGVFRYAEQSSGHYIAFKLLALLRDKIFKKLRKLAPAKLEGRDKGNLISIITSDIELLEVFYAHTIAPIVIGVVTSIIMVIFIYNYNHKLAIIAVLAYFTIGFILPMINSKLGKQKGMEYRDEFGELNTYFLESLYGLRESIQFETGIERLNKINLSSDELDNKQKY